MQKKELLREIEVYRKKMSEAVAAHNSLGNKNVLEISRHLDKLMNEYNKRR